MKTYLKIVCIVLLLALVGCSGQNGGSSQESVTANPKKVVSVADLAVQSLISNAPGNPDSVWLGKLKEMRKLDQAIREHANYTGDYFNEELASLTGRTQEEIEKAQGNYVYMQSCCICGPRCCGCTRYMISTQDISSLSLSDSANNSFTATYTDDGPARIFIFTPAPSDGDYTLTIHYTVNGTSKTLTIPVEIYQKKVVGKKIG